MASFQQTVIVGNVGGNPELKYLPSGTPVCNFSVAVTEKWTDRQSNEKREKTTWYRVTAWAKLAEIANTYIRKGTPVFVSGTVEAHGYTGQDGTVNASLELTARTIQFFGGSSDNAGQSQPSSAPTYSPTDFPF